MPQLPKIVNRRIAWQIFHNSISGKEVSVPYSKDTKLAIALASNVPRRFVVILDEQSFCVSVPETTDLCEAEISCTICGDQPSNGRTLLDRDIHWDYKVTCHRCSPEYLCSSCRVEIDSEFCCLACVTPEEEHLLSDQRRLRALEMWWSYVDETEAAVKQATRRIEEAPQEMKVRPNGDHRSDF